MFTSPAVYTLSEKPDVGDESEFEEGSQLHPGIVGEESWTHKDHNTDDKSSGRQKKQTLMPPGQKTKSLCLVLLGFISFSINSHIFDSDLFLRLLGLTQIETKAHAVPHFAVGGFGHEYIPF